MYPCYAPLHALPVFHVGSLFVYVVISSENVLENVTDETSEYEEVSGCSADNIFSFLFAKAQVVLHL